MDQVFTSRKGLVRWENVFCWWPRKSNMGKASLWGKRAYRGVLTLGDRNGNIVDIVMWISKEEFLMEKLRGTI